MEMNVNAHSQPFSSGIGKMLIRAGVEPQVAGFAMLGAAVEIAVEGGMANRKIVADLYPQVAGMFGTTPYGVERNIRTAIAKAWSSGALRHFYDGVGMYAERRPSNAACIAQFAYAYTSGMLEDAERAK